MKILDCIPTGHKNAIQRDKLSSMTHMGDRQMRESIAEVNSNNNPGDLIINLQDGKGYFRPALAEDNLVRLWRAQENSGRSKMDGNVQAADRYLTRNRKRPEKISAIPGQMELMDL